jgi:hypothetical protein
MSDDPYMMRYRGHRDVAITALPEPRVRALIACQIQLSGTAWTNRTYEVIRADDGQWLLDFGEGWREPRRDWNAVLDWLVAMRPRDIEMMEVP